MSWNLYIIWELPYVSACYLLWNSATYGTKFCMPTCAVPSVCNTWDGSHVDRGHYWEENEHFIELTEGKQNTTCRVPYSIHCADCQRFYRTMCLWAQAYGRMQAPDRACSITGIQRDEARNAISIQAETERSNVSACWDNCPTVLVISGIWGQSTPATRELDVQFL